MKSELTPIRYYLQTDWQDDWTEVTKQQFIDAERNAGFRSNTPGEPATGYFSGRGVRGKVEYAPPAAERSER